MSEVYDSMLKNTVNSALGTPRYYGHPITIRVYSESLGKIIVNCVVIALPVFNEN